MVDKKKPENSPKCEIIQFPEFVELKEEVDKLTTELSMLISEHDELRYVICKNIEMEYMLTLGGLEYKAFELNCEMLRLKRKVELIQMRINRQEKINIAEIELILDEEFAEFQDQLERELNKMNAALERGKGELLSKEETKELKTLYRAIVKVLHPDLHPELTDAQLQLFYNAVSAYENGDLLTLRIIHQMTAEPVTPEVSESGLEALTKEKDRLLEIVDSVKEKISDTKKKYPYILKPIVESEELTAEKKAELNETISWLKESIELYTNRIHELMERK